MGLKRKSADGERVDGVLADVKVDEVGAAGDLVAADGMKAVLVQAEVFESAQG